MITIGIVSFNRLKYLKALIKSLEILDRSKFTLTVVDNGSWETGLQEFLTAQRDLGQIQNLFLRRSEDRNWINDEYIAKNIVIENCSDDCIVFLQDDLQFINEQSYLMTLCQDFMDTDYQCLEFNGIRRSTVLSKFSTRRSFLSKSNLRYWISDKPHFQTMGIFKTKTFKKLGPYPVEWPKERQYWGRSEDYYDLLVKKNYSNINISAHCPAFLSVWNDKRGGYAFFRNDLRYAEYKDTAGDQGLYYKPQNYDFAKSCQQKDLPLSFMDVAQPIGWSITTSSDGDQAKYSQNSIVKSEMGEKIT